MAKVRSNLDLCEFSWVVSQPQQPKAVIKVVVCRVSVGWRRNNQVNGLGPAYPVFQLSRIGRCEVTDTVPKHGLRPDYIANDLIESTEESL